MSLGLFKKCYQQNVLINGIYLIYMYKLDLASNNLQRLISYKTKRTQQKIIIFVYILCFLSLFFSLSLSLIRSLSLSFTLSLSLSWSSSFFSLSLIHSLSLSVFLFFLPLTHSLSLSLSFSFSLSLLAFLFFFSLSMLFCPELNWMHLRDKCWVSLLGVFVKLNLAEIAVDILL